MTTKLATAILGALLLPAILIAQSDVERFVRRMAKDDKNGDGKLTQTEFTGPNRLFQQLDEDGDGVLVLKDAAKKLKEIREIPTKGNEKAAGNPSSRAKPGIALPRELGLRGDRKLKVQPDYQNVRYGEHERHVFDIYLAKTEVKKPAPCMIWIHGGGFRRGDKSEGSLFSREFTNNGIHYVTLNYRLSHHAIAPACFHDCARALQFIRRNADKWGIDKTRIAVGGGSAGAGLSQWLAFSPDRADPNSEDPILRESTRVSALILLNAQTSYDFRWIKEHIPGDAWKGEALQQLFGYSIENADEISREKYQLIQDCSPITHFRRDAPPILFFYRRSKDPKIAEQNALDGIHHPIFGLELKKRADQLNVRCEVFSIENENGRAFYNRRWDYSVRFLKQQFQME